MKFFVGVTSTNETLSVVVDVFASYVYRMWFLFKTSN